MNWLAGFQVLLLLLLLRVTYMSVDMFKLLDKK